MTKKITRFWAVVLAFLLAVVSPVTNAWHRFFSPSSTDTKEPTSVGAAEASAATALAFTVLPMPTGPPEAAPFAGPTEIFINELLVLDSIVGLVTASLPATDFLSGIGYSVESYMRVTLAAPNNPNYIRGWAVDNTGAVHIFDASGGLPANVQWQDGLPVTLSGQLCVVFG